MMLRGKMSVWIVTGGVGFIGYHLTRALVHRGVEVRIVDDFSDAPYPAAQKRINQADLERECGGAVTVTSACITDVERIASAFRGAEGVVHLAGLAGVRPSFDAPARYARINVEGMATVFEVARDAGIKRFAFASSSSVYGNSSPLPAHEDVPAVVPESPYAATKRGAELVLSALSLAAPHIACAALRFFTVYGPRQRPEMAISTFTRACLAGEPITLFGDGSMRRDFTHVDDIVGGILAAIDGAKPGFRAFNLGSGAPITLNSLLAAIGSATGKSPIVQRSAVQLGDVEATFADIRRAKAELGWSPRIDLTAGLRTVVDWLTLQSVSAALTSP